MFQAVETINSMSKYDLVSKKKNLLGIRNKKKLPLLNMFYPINYGSEEYYFQIKFNYGYFPFANPYIRANQYV